MKGIIRSDIYRLVHSKGFYIYWLIIAFVYGITVKVRSPGGIIFGYRPDISGFKTDIGQIAFGFNYYFFMIMPVFIIVLSDFSLDTIKNTISSGVSKTRYFAAKYVFTVAFVLCSILLASCAFYFTYRLVNGADESSAFSDFIKYTLMQLPIFAAIASAFIFLAVLSRKAAVFNSVTCITPLVYMFAAGVTTLLKYEKATRILARYEVGRMLASVVENDDDHLTRIYIISAAAIVITFVGGLALFKKRDVK